MSNPNSKQQFISECIIWIKVVRRRGDDPRLTGLGFLGSSHDTPQLLARPVRDHGAGAAGRTIAAANAAVTAAVAVCILPFIFILVVLIAYPFVNDGMMGQSLKDIQRL